MKFIVQKYDPAVTKAPLQFIDLAEVERDVDRDDVDYIVCRNIAQELGYIFRFYSFHGDDSIAITVWENVSEFWESSRTPYDLEL